MPTKQCDRCNMAWGDVHNCYPPAQLVAAEARIAALTAELRDAKELVRRYDDACFDADSDEAADLIAELRRWADG
jgi:hypothetical protein